MSRPGTGPLHTEPTKERVALISGATGAAGRAAALSLARQGVRLTLVSSKLEKLESMQSELALPEDRTLLFATDLTESSGARYAIEATLARYGRLNILLHLVGGWAGGEPASQVPFQVISKMVNQHLWTTFHMLQACVPPMLAAGWGRIITVSSPVAIRPGANTPAYNVGKAAQDALVLSLAAELKGSGVTANVIQVKAINVGAEPKAGQATPQEIASAVLFLCAPESAMINGARLPLTGETV